MTQQQQQSAPLSCEAWTDPGAAGVGKVCALTTRAAAGELREAVGCCWQEGWVLE